MVFPAENIVDEDSRTAWVAATNNDTEWLQVDLQHLSSVNAIQVNFDEYGAKQKGLRSGCLPELCDLCLGEWGGLVSGSGLQHERRIPPHDYIEFEEPFKARYIKLQNKEYTVSSNLSVRDLRIFGNGLGSKPVR